MKKYAWLVLVWLVLPTALLSGQTSERTVTRLFWQDMSNHSLRWGDLKQGESWKLEAKAVEGFPKLDEEKQSLVQMQVSDGVVVTGVHDTEDGAHQSGWVAIESGVLAEAHGDHFHWKYAAVPTIKKSQLDAQQGNPAHVYAYDGNFYLANDKKDGATMISPAALRQASEKQPAKFFSAGGGHITLAAVENRVLYGTWIDREGDNRGRVDVVSLKGSNRYSFQLPSGGIHGATASSGKVFFAPADGVCWVAADLDVLQKPEAVKVHHVSLGNDAEGNPKRTGAFANHRNWVVFTTGRGKASELCLLNAASSNPAVQKLAIPVQAGNSTTTPVCLRTGTGHDLALICEESADGSQKEKLHVVHLDPNHDGQTQDAKLERSIEIGPSLIQGHSGHHELTSFGRHVALSNPGDGSVWLFLTSDWSIVAKLSVGGNPTRLLAVGGK